MPDLIPPHGGLQEPVCCTVGAAEIDDFKRAAASLAKVPVKDADLSTVYRFGDGALSPLTGFMDRATWNRVLDESVIEHGGKLYAWTIPLALPVTAELAKSLKPGQNVALTNSAGLNSAYSRLGIPPDKAAQFTPTILDAVGKAGGDSVRNLLATALK